MGIACADGIDSIAVPQKLKAQLSYDLAVLKYISKELKTEVSEIFYTPMFITALCTITKTRKQLVFIDGPMDE